MDPKTGEVWLADLGIAGKTRPVVIVSRNDPDPPRVLFVIVPFSTQNRRSDYEVDPGPLPFLNAPSVMNVQGILSVPRSRLLSRLGSLSSEQLLQLRKALSYLFQL